MSGRRLLFFCPTKRRPVGGIKVLYRQAELANKLLGTTPHSAAIVHPNRPFYKASWFSANPPILPLLLKPHIVNGKLKLTNIQKRLDPARDRIILPELWAHKYGPQLIREQIPYAIYVQGGYLINTKPQQDTELAYHGARAIFTISDNTTECVARAYPFTQQKLFRVHYSVNHSIFHLQQQKQNIITYMPRKLARHADLLKLFITPHLPKTWKLIPIDNATEIEVARQMQTSKIFLSHIELEGLPIPPLEAALTGNMVIGYTGQGGTEYWHEPIFKKIEHGALLDFAKEIINATTTDFDRFIEQSQSQRMALKNLYSEATELKDVENIISIMLN